VVRGDLWRLWQEENILDWTIRRTVDGKEKEPYTLDDRFKALKPGVKITVNMGRLFAMRLLIFSRVF